MGGKKRVAVLGAGASGITAIKCCIDDDLEPVCFERTDHIGGLWYYTPDSTDGLPCVMKSTVINTSKEMMCYSDFQIPKEFANYMHNTKVLEYMDMYVEHFDLKKFVRFKTEVLSVKRAPDFDQTGQWTLEIKDLPSGKVTTEIFDAVLLCTGHHADKNIPTIEGQENFKGKIVHTHDYKSHEGMEDKRVVVLGIGNSGGDVASELGKVCNQVYLSTRRGSWIFHRVGDYGLPVDMVVGTRISSILREIVPTNAMNTIIEGIANKKFDHELYGLRPKHRILSAHPTVNDDLPNRIIAGSVVIKPNIKKIHPTSVEFEDGSVAENIDVIILGTGYKFGFPFLEKGIIDVHENKANLYKMVLPPDLKHPTLGAIGFIQPWGAIFPISETQCRWATQLFKGERKPPDNESMWADIRKREDDMKKRYVSSPRHTIQVDYVSYMDELAEQIGCKPDLKRLFLSDPKLAWQVLFGPAAPYQYRIHGPHPWSGARKAIMTMWDRAYYPFQTRKAEKAEKSNFFFILFVTIVLAVILKLFLF